MKFWTRKYTKSQKRRFRIIDTRRGYAVAKLAGEPVWEVLHYPPTDRKHHRFGTFHDEQSAFQRMFDLAKRK